MSTMSYAVETKKRKFHRVLESLSKPLSADATKKPDNGALTTTRTSDRPSTADSAAKRARLTTAEGLDSSAVARNIIRRVGKPSGRASPISPAGRPSFVPWDRERFLERLKTFRRVDWWSPKPAPINEVAWAKRGWMCTGAMRVTCVGGCGGSVVVKLPDEIDELDGYDMEKVQERKDVRMCSIASILIFGGSFTNRF